MLVVWADGMCAIKLSATSWSSLHRLSRGMVLGAEALSARPRSAGQETMVSGEASTRRQLLVTMALTEASKIS